jgi:hypothetical protein
VIKRTSRFPTLKLFAAVAVAVCPLLRAQELKVQPTPFTVWLDFKKLTAPGVPQPQLPVWMESFQVDAKKLSDGTVTKTIYRIRTRRLSQPAESPRVITSPPAAETNAWPAAEEAMILRTTASDFTASIYPHPTFPESRKLPAFVPSAGPSTKPQPQPQPQVQLQPQQPLVGDLLFRLFFDDTWGASPVVSAWSDIGSQLLEPTTLGQGLDLPTSQTVAVPMRGVDYIEICVPGDGSNVQGAFLSSLKSGAVKYAADFQTPSVVADPFENEPARQPGDDSYLFGRVKATLESAVVKLLPYEAPGTELDFELDAQPLLSVITFEILNANVNAPPHVIANDHDLGPASLILPDLADPGYNGAVHALEADVRFRYTGWLRGQKAVPTSALHAGENKIVLQLENDPGAVAIRAIEVQLKHAETAGTP